MCVGLLLEIEESLIEHEIQMVDLCVALSQLDALISLAEVAQERQYVKPAISDENVIIIKNGRHPLQVILNTAKSRFMLKFKYRSLPRSLDS